MRNFIDVFIIVNNDFLQFFRHFFVRRLGCPNTGNGLCYFGKFITYITLAVISVQSYKQRFSSQ